MAKSWFYLTLWRGTPPEFTQEITADILTTSCALASIISETQRSAQITTSHQKSVAISTDEHATSDITTRTEVVWIVG